MGFLDTPERRARDREIQGLVQGAEQGIRREEAQKVLKRCNPKAIAAAAAEARAVRKR